jgi:hypothetical protein
MNRLIVTLMLVFALALGLAKLANADDAPTAPPAPAKAPAVKKAVVRRAPNSGTAASTTADSQSAANLDGDFTETIDDSSVTTSLKDGKVSSRVLQCKDCAAPIELKALDTSLQSTVAAKKNLAEIQAYLHDTTVKDANLALDQEDRRAKLQDDLDDMIAACEVSPDSKVKKHSDGSPYIDKVRFSGRSGTGHHRERKSKDDDSELTSDSTSFDIDQFDSPADDEGNEVFTKLEVCRAKSLQDSPSSKVEAKLISAMVNEYGDLLDRVGRGEVLSSKDAARFAGLQKYMNTIRKDQHYATLVQQATSLRLAAAYNNFLGFANQAGGSTAAAAQLRAQGGGLSEGAKQSFQALLSLAAGDSSGRTQAFGQYKISDLTALTKKIDTNVSKGTSNSADQSNPLLAAYKTSGGSSVWDDASNQANRIARAAGMGDEVGQWKYSEPTTMSGGINTPARFARRSYTASTPCMNATAYSSTMNTNNSFANSVPQACQTQSGSNLGTNNGFSGRNS